MKRYAHLRRTLSLVLLLSILLGILPVGVLGATAHEPLLTPEGTSQEDTPALRSILAEGESPVPTWQQGPARHYRLKANPCASSEDGNYSYPYMAAMTALGNYAYFIRTGSARDDVTKINANLSMIDLSTQKHTRLKIGSSYNTTLFGSAKSLSAVTVGSKDYLLVATGDTSAGIRLFEITKDSNGVPTAVTLKATYAVKNSAGQAHGADRVEVLSTDGSTVQLLIRCSWSFYTATLDVNAGNSNLTLSPAVFHLDSTTTKSIAKEIAGMPQSFSAGLEGSPEKNIDKFNILGMACYDDRLYVSAHMGCNSVILVYTGLSQLLNSGDSQAVPNTDLCILVSNAGYETLYVQDLAILNGVIYYCNRMYWLSSPDYRGDICHFINSTSPRHDIMEGFRENKLYTIRGAGTYHFVIVRDGDELKIVSDETDSFNLNSSAFGLESDGQGYWYIRSMSNAKSTDKKYITLGDSAYTGGGAKSGDQTITLSDKVEGSDHQRWSIRDTGDKNSLGHRLFAIQSKVNGLYLNFREPEKDNRPLVATLEGKTYDLTSDFQENSDEQTELEDLLFDYEFYRAAYMTPDTTKAQAKAHYDAEGKEKGYLPSPYFDPVYYQEHNTDVRNSDNYQGYVGAYNHFVKKGFWEGRQGSVFFSAAEYVSREQNKDIFNAYYPDKVKILSHYITDGLNESTLRNHRRGSDEFDLKEYMEEFDIDASSTTGTAELRNYVSTLIRMYRSTGTELEKYLFDVNTYKKENSSLTEATLRAANIGTAADDHNALLTKHWKSLGSKEGRTASIYFSAPYYIEHNPGLGLTFANAYKHFIETGVTNKLVASEYTAMGMDPELHCRHDQIAIAWLPSCTDICSKVEFCAACHFLVHREDSPALSHQDTDNNSYCDTCGNEITSDLLDQNSLLQLPIPVPTNELVPDVSAFEKDSAVKPDGIYYMVQKNSDGVYRIFNPLVQSKIGTIAATQVFDIGGKLLGTDPDMAVEIYYNTEPNGQTADTNHYYIKMEGWYHLSFKRDSIKINEEDEKGKVVGYKQIYRQIAGTNLGTTTRTVEDPAGSTKLLHTVAFARNIENELIKYKKTYSLCLEQQGGLEFFEWSYNNASLSNSKTFEPEDSFLLYRLLTDRLHTEALYAALQKAVDYVPSHSNYDITVYNRFRSIIAEAKALYEQYNGTVLTGNSLTNKEALQANLDKVERELLDTMSILSINRRGNAVEYFSATMYNWNEDAMNAEVQKVANLGGKGFFFENANNKPVPASPFSDYDDTTAHQETVSGKKFNSQMYSIYSGIAAKDLYSSNNPPFHNSNVVTADFWSAKPIKGAKEVYTDVRIPFIYDKETGYYTLDSDSNGVFFERAPASGSTLAILDKPMTYMWSGGLKFGIANPSYYINNLYSYKPSNGYITAFQPFAQPTAYTGLGYLASASNIVGSTPVESYIMDGAALKSGKALSLDNFGRGTPTWGFGMNLSVDFQVTADGKLNNGKPITFSFSGDDDVWVYIDSKLVMDIGGSHDAIQGQIDFSTGEVTVWSEKYGRIRDKNESGYARGTDASRYDDNVSSIGSILNGVKMQQPNIYSEVFKKTVSDFSAEGKHTLMIFYMDRGKGRTNCAISFNLPQSDVLIAEKEIAPYYGKEDGTLTQTAISAKTMDHLNTLDFGFTLTENGSPAAYEYYTLYDAKGLQAGRWKTDVKGHFTLKNGYRAEFDTLQFNGQNYQIIEEDPGPRWGKVSWSGVEYDTLLDPIDGYTSQEASVTGDPYEIETISYVCTNTYIYYPELTPEDQVVVMDYGKPIYLSVIDNLVFTGAAELVVRDGTLKSIACTNETGTGYVTLKKDSANRGATLSLKKLLDRNIKIKAVVKVTLDDGTVRDNITVNIQVFPATLMYYETNFLSDPSKVFKTTVKNPASEEYNWTEKTATGKDDLQDSGEIGDEVYKPLIDKEFVPSNAFFVDFDGKGYKDRYSADPVYKGHDFDVNGNWVTHHVADPVENTNGTPLFPYDSAYTIDQKTGVFVLDVKTGYSVTSDWKGKMYGPEFYTTAVSGSLQGNPLEYTYSNEDYFEIRFMSEDCVFDPLETGAANPKVVLRILYRDETNTLKEKYLHLDYTFKDGSYQVVTGALPTEVKGLPIISFGVRFQHLRAKDGVEAGKIYVDYLYVGPKTGWAESVNSDYLYFGFENEQGDQLRYGTGVYTGKNYDAQGSDGNNPNWAVSHNNTKCDSVSNLDGTLTVNVAHNPEKAENCGPRLMTTGKNNTFPISSSSTIVSAAQGLNFDLRNAEYIQIRFKTENCTWSSSDNAHSMYFFFTYINKEGEECISTNEITAKYSLETEEYQYYRIKLTKDHPIIANGKTLTNFGLRFRSIIGKNNTDGKIIIDHLFIGTEEAMYRLDTPEEAMFFDFNNTEADQIRYSSDIYGGYNFDRAENAQWGMSYGGSTQTVSTETRENKNRFEIADGMIRLNITRKPYSDQTRIGTTAFAFDPNDTDNPAGYYPWNTSVKRMPLSFPSNSADYVQIRFKVVDCEPLSDSDSPNIGLIFYHNNSAGSIDYAIANSANYEITDDFITLTYSTGSKLDISRTVTGLGISFRNIRCKEGCEDTAAVYLDYLYIGKMAESNPAADSLYIGFDNMAEDRERYASDTYGNINLDSEETTHWVWNSNKVESMTIDNNAGTATITALEEMVEYDSDGVVIFPDVYAEVGENGKFFNDPLDFKPQYAEIFQMRFKMTGFRNGDYADAEAENGLRTVNPYIKLFWRLAGEEQADNVILASDTITLNNTKNFTVNDYTVITKGTWVTVTAKIPEEVRNSHSVASIRPYFGGLESLGDGVKGEITIDYVYIGPDDRPDQVYGYDSHYNNDTTLSDGHSLFVEGSGVKLSDTTATYTETSFSFKGTGFDIISRTGPKQATIRVEVVGPTVDKEGNPTVDVVKSMTVNTKGELELYQIPVVSVQGLPYGEYTVTLWVNKAVNSNYPFLSRGGEFYFDAVRIYTPMSQDNYSQYKADREAYPRIKELRNILLSADTFGQIVDSESGAVFIDVNSSNVDPDTGNILDPTTGESTPGSTGYLTATVQTYNKQGPKNEIYLAPGQAVAFNLQVSTIAQIMSLDIGAKTITNSAAHMEIGLLAKDAAGNFTISTHGIYTVTSATAQYWEVDITDAQVRSDAEGIYQPMYLVIYNTSPVNSGTDRNTVTNNVLSLTDVKVTYKGNPSDGTPEVDSPTDTEIQKRTATVATEPVEFLVDGNTMTAARYFIDVVAETPMLDGNAKIYHSLNLASDISLNYIVPMTDVANYDSFCLELQIPVYEGNTLVGSRGITLSPVAKGNYWYFTLEGLTAVHMMDEISARLVMESNGRTYYSETDRYSIAQYAMTQLEKSNSSAKLKVLCANLLRYGAKAQLYKNYRVDFLADRMLTEDQIALLTDLDTVSFGSNSKVVSTIEDPKITRLGKSLILDSKVTVRFIIEVKDTAPIAEDLSIRIRYTDSAGNEKLVTLENAQPYGNTGTMYSFDFDGLLAAELRTVLYATVYAGDTPVSDTYSYSVDSYGAGKTGALGTLCRALMAYSDCANAFFG